jgi:phospholipid/cholesterol/gamma-HCH transport system permease protein
MATTAETLKPQAQLPARRRKAINVDRGPIGWMTQVAEMTMLLGQTIRAMVVPPYTWAPEAVEQCWLVAKRAFIPVVFTTAMFSWGAPGITGGSMIATLATTDRLGAFAVMASVRELGPWLNGMTVAGVAGTAICADLGARKIREELDALSVLGADLVKELIVPRFVALGVMTIIFNSWNVLVSIVVTMLANMMVWQETASGFVSTFSSNFTIAELVFNILRVLSFGFIAAIVCCYKGMNARGGAEGVGRAVNQAVVISFVAIYFYNYFINALQLGAFPETATLR